MAATAKTKTDTETETDTPPSRRGALPNWLTLTLMSAFLVLVAGTVWAIASIQTGCSFLDVAPSSDTMPWPQPCSPDATAPALVTIWLIALLLAAAFVVAFTVVRRARTVLLIIAGAMLLIAVFGVVATFVAASAQPPIIDYWPVEDVTP
jgi:hypothetical protein